MLGILLAAATAGELQISVMSPVIIYVDGVMIQPPTGTNSMTVGGLAGGSHLVEARTMFNKSITEVSVDVGAEEQVRLRYQRKTFEELGRGAPTEGGMTVSSTVQGGATPAQAMSDMAAAMNAMVGGVEASVSAIDEMAGVAEPAPEPAPTTAAVPVAAAPAVASGPGDFVLTGASKLQGDKAWYGGTAMSWEGDDLVLRGITPGVYEVYVERDGRPIIKGDMDVPAGAERRCGIVYEGLGLTLECTQIGGSTPVASTGVAATGGGTTESATAAVSVGGVSMSASITVTESGGGASMAFGGMPGAAPVAAAPAGPTAMDGSSFAALRTAVANESFSSDQVDLVRTAAAGNWFTIGQVGLLMNEVSFAWDKLAIAEACAPKVVDPGNAYQLNDFLSFSSDKEKVQALFR